MWLVIYLLVGIPIGRHVAKYVIESEARRWPNSPNVDAELRVIAGIFGLIACILWPLSLVIWLFGGFATGRANGD